mmetsp:Transcript_31854/g.43698  ORF Transcript_31854/g.43698 Transcript_31854/m.43698 type:complete len:491 (-) Transcript_31854:23-1495(-)|eukprot:CAMPEP_0201475220 /NCGR_PEP_ID=MMETSP0151_2-20130828/672_1 /ASSEMBLY_ACC=CAM_ASM_000257 /TAXON_ID=200890 /ORGANISM="Paramoeba atlantica, Strain 621/1 / CCAP 1560/9" /LENGTH=490 /DNA_ID=CAMNT_0047855253 /DNA_START=67 /DNA_END=1539 /DNA_ORIENTATION=-
MVTSVLEPNAVPFDIANVAVIFMFCFVILWAYRIVLKACLLTELNLAIDHNAIFRLENIPEEQLNQEGGFIPRSQIEKVLRNRRLRLYPPTVVQCVSNPTHIHRKSISLIELPLHPSSSSSSSSHVENEESEMGLGLKFSFDSSTDCRVSLNKIVCRNSFVDILGLEDELVEDDLSSSSDERKSLERQILLPDQEDNEKLEGEKGDDQQKKNSKELVKCPCTTCRDFGGDFLPQSNPFTGARADWSKDFTFLSGSQQTFETQEPFLSAPLSDLERDGIIPLMVVLSPLSSPPPPSHEIVIDMKGEDSLQKEEEYFHEVLILSLKKKKQSLETETQSEEEKLEKEEEKDLSEQDFPDSMGVSIEMKEFAPSTEEKGEDEERELTTNSDLKEETLSSQFSVVTHHHLLVKGPELQVYEVKEIFDDDHSKDCVVCLTNPRDTTLLPCRHFCVCGHCMEMLTKCPICRCKLVSFLRWKDQDEITQTTATELEKD